MDQSNTPTPPQWAELLPCPFCGGPVELEEARPTRDYVHGERRWWGVVCRNTTNLGGTCCMEQVPSASKEAAVTRWNRRASMQAQAPEVSALQREVEEMRADAQRLDWLLHRVSGKELRRLGIETSSGGPLWGRVAIDAAMASKAEGT